MELGSAVFLVPWREKNLLFMNKGNHFSIENFRRDNGEKGMMSQIRAMIETELLAVLINLGPVTPHTAKRICLRTANSFAVVIEQLWEREKGEEKLRGTSLIPFLTICGK